MTCSEMILYSFYGSRRNCFVMVLDRGPAFFSVLLHHMICNDANFSFVFSCFLCDFYSSLVQNGDEILCINVAVCSWITGLF